jgi:uncharacterized protein involved in outer membrane biogenesis
VNVVELQDLTATPPRQKRASAWVLLPPAYAAAPPQPGILQRMTGTGTLMAGSILYDQLELNNVRSNVTLDRGIIRLNPVTAQVYGGQQAGSIVLDTRQTPMTVQVASKLSGVDANKLISSMTSLKQTLYGLLSANSQLALRAASSSDLTRSLNGTLSLDLAKGRIVGIDLLHQLASVGKFLRTGQQAQQPFTDLLRLTGAFNIRNGLAQTNNLQAVINGGTLGATGAVNLVDQGLNLHLTAVLSKALTQQVGGTSIGGFMNTALQNNRGEMVIPVIVTGTFQRPIFAPDVQKIAQMKLQHALPTLNNPGVGGALGAILGQGASGQQKGVGGILGQITGQQQQPAAPQKPGQPNQTQQNQQNQNANPLADALNQIIGGKKKQQPQQPQK